MPRLQRNIDVVDTIASVGSPPEGVDTTVAETITGVGAAARDFAVKRSKSKLQEELEQFADEVSAAKMGKQVEDAGKRFDRLRKAREQGTLTQDMVDIETEAILKQSIERMPAFAQELRQFAADRLGFDPTGEQLRQKLTIPSPKADPIETKAVNIYNNLLAGGGSDIPTLEDIRFILANAQLKKEQADIIASQAAIGARGRRDILNATIQESNGKFADTMVSILDQIQSGGVKDPGVVKAIVTSMAASHQRDLMRRYQAAGISPDSTEISADLAAIDRMWAPLIQMANDGSLTDIVENNKKAIASMLTIEGYNLFGDLSAIEGALGQEGVKNAFTLIEKADDPAALALLKSINPELERLADQFGAVKVLTAEGYKRVMGVEPAFSQLPNYLSEEDVDAAADAALHNLTKDNNLSDAEKDARAAYAIAAGEGKKWRTVSAYMQKGARRNATDAEVQFMTGLFEEEYPALIYNIAAELSDPRFKDVVIEVDRGGLLTVNTPREVRNEQIRNARSAFNVPPAPSQRVSPISIGDLRRLQAFNQGVQNGWAKDFGKDPATFMSETIGLIEGLRQTTIDEGNEVQDLIDDYFATGNPESLEKLRELDPDVVAAAEKAAASIATFRGQRRSGDSNE